MLDLEYTNRRHAEKSPASDTRVLHKPPANIFIFGIGQGKQICTLADRLPGSQIAVFDPEPAYRESAVKQFLASRVENGSVRILRKMDSFDRYVADRIIHGDSPETLMLFTAGYRDVFPAAAKSFENSLMSARLRRTVIDKTLKEKGRFFRAHLAENLKTVMGLPVITSLKEKFSGVPGFVVGSGPGLEKNGGLIKKAAETGLILAAGSALKPLIELGVDPDVVVIIEAEDTTSFVEEVPGAEKRITAVASASNPAHFNLAGHTLTAFHLSPGAAFLFGSEDFTPQGGTAGSAAFTIGLILGLSPLVLLGQDQAFGPGKLHAGGTPGEEEFDPSQAPFLVKGLDGGMVRTHSGLAASLHWFAEAARFMREKYKSVEVINATESGASIPGVPDRTLKEVLEALRPLPNGKPDMISMLKDSGRPDPKRIRNNLEQTYSVIGNLSLLLRNFKEDPWELIAESRKNNPILKDLLAGREHVDDTAGPLASLDEAEALVLKMMEAVS